MDVAEELEVSFSKVIEVSFRQLELRVARGCFLALGMARAFPVAEWKLLRTATNQPHLSPLTPSQQFLAVEEVIVGVRVLIHDIQIFLFFAYSAIAILCQSSGDEC